VPTDRGPFANAAEIERALIDGMTTLGIGASAAESPASS
jgi:hypothetical protein